MHVNPKLKMFLLQMELESYDYEPYDYGLEDQDFYDTTPPKQSKSTRRVTFGKRVYAKVRIFLL